MYNIMQTKFETRVRGLALIKGLELVRVETRSGMAADGDLYRLVSGNGVTIFPPGRGVEGESLHETEDWLIHPWE